MLDFQENRAVDEAIEALSIVLAGKPEAVTDIAARLSAAGLGVTTSPKATVSNAKEVGQRDDQRGIYLGTVAFDYNGNVVDAYVASDVLRDESGQPLFLTFNAAANALAARNQGRRYGSGSFSEVCKAILSGAYVDGDAVLPPDFLVGGYGQRLYALPSLQRPNENVVSLINNGTTALDKLKAFAQSGRSGADRFFAGDRSVVSSSLDPENGLLVSHVNLSDGLLKLRPRALVGRSAVLPVRLYRTPSPAPAIGG